MLEYEQREAHPAGRLKRRQRGKLLGELCRSGGRRFYYAHVSRKGHKPTTQSIYTTQSFLYHMVLFGDYHTG